MGDLLRLNKSFVISRSGDTKKEIYILKFTKKGDRNKNLYKVPRAAWVLRIASPLYALVDHDHAHAHAHAHKHKNFRRCAQVPLSQLQNPQ